MAKAKDTTAVATVEDAGAFERAQLEKFETAVQEAWDLSVQNMQTVAAGLYGIQRLGLYKFATDSEGNPIKTFSAFLKDRGWNLSAGRASQLVTGEATRLLESGTDEEKAEAQAFIDTRRKGGPGRDRTIKGEARAILKALERLTERVEQAEAFESQADNYGQYLEAVTAFADALAEIDTDALKAIVEFVDEADDANKAIADEDAAAAEAEADGF